MEKFRTKAETAFNLKKNVWISINDSVRVLIQDSTSNSIRKSVLDKISYSIRDSVINLVWNLIWRQNLVLVGITIISLIRNDLEKKFKRRNK